MRETGPPLPWAPAPSAPPAPHPKIDNPPAPHKNSGVFMIQPAFKAQVWESPLSCRFWELDRARWI